MNPEKPENKKGGSIIEQPNVQTFIEMRGIQPEDFKIIEKLTTFPKDTIIDLFHNFFTSYHEESSNQLEKLLNSSHDENHKALYSLFFELSKKYDWHTCYQLAGILENLK